MSVSLRDKWQLMQAIFADHRLSQSAKVVAGVLLGHLNTVSLRCDPRVETLEARCGLKRRSILSALGELRDRGWLTQKRRRGSSTYSFAFDRYEVQLSAPLEDAEEVQISAPLEVQNSAHVQVQLSAPLEYSNEKSVKKGISANKGAADHGFEEWYSNYPLAKGRGKARQKYKSVLRSGKATHAELLAGAMRYAAEKIRPDGSRDPYTKHPATWLHQECWADESTPVSATSAPPNARSLLEVIGEAGGYTEAKPKQPSAGRNLLGGRKL